MADTKYVFKFAELLSTGNTAWTSNDIEKLDNPQGHLFLNSDNTLWYTKVDSNLTTVKVSSTPKVHVVDNKLILNENNNVNESLPYHYTYADVEGYPDDAKALNTLHREFGHQVGDVAIVRTELCKYVDGRIYPLTNEETKYSITGYCYKDSQWEKFNDYVNPRKIILDENIIATVDLAHKVNDTGYYEYQVAGKNLPDALAELFTYEIIDINLLIKSYPNFYCYVNNKTTPTIETPEVGVEYALEMWGKYVDGTYTYANSKQSIGNKAGCTIQSVKVKFENDTFDIDPSSFVDMTNKFGGNQKLGTYTFLDESTHNIEYEYTYSDAAYEARTNVNKSSGQKINSNTKYEKNSISKIEPYVEGCYYGYLTESQYNDIKNLTPTEQLSKFRDLALDTQINSAFKANKKIKTNTVFKFTATNDTKYFYVATPYKGTKIFTKFYSPDTNQDSFNAFATNHNIPLSVGTVTNNYSLSTQVLTTTLTKPQVFEITIS